MTVTQRDIERFWHQVERSDGCWLWLGETNNCGYGRLSLWSHRQRTRIMAHRLSFLLAYGGWPPVVMHKCDNPLCVRPDHLIAGTQADNVQDCVNKGRASRPPLHIGQRHPHAKLTDTQVTEIRDTYPHGNVSQRELARKYGVSQTTIGMITRGESRC